MPNLNKCHEVSTLPSREMRTLKVMVATSTTVTKTSLNNRFGKWWLFCSYWFFLAASFILDRARCKWTGRSTVEVNLEKDLNLEISRCHSADYRIVLKCVPHVQHVRHDYLSSLNQSDHYFWRLCCRCIRGRLWVHFLCLTLKSPAQSVIKSNPNPNLKGIRTQTLTLELQTSGLCLDLARHFVTSIIVDLLRLLILFSQCRSCDDT